MFIIIIIKIKNERKKMLTIQILKIFTYFAMGFFIPVLSRFLMKFYPCSLHSYIGDILKYNFKNKRKNKLNNSHYQNMYNILKKRHFYNKLFYGILFLFLSFTLTYLLKNYINKDYPLILFVILLFLLIFSSNIDNKCRLIPDIITLPMLLIGILISIYCKNNEIYSPILISPINSIISSLFTYILCSCLALMFYFKSPYAFGGGDVKLLTALASFTGFENLGKILIISFIIMLIYCSIKKERFAPLAPFIFTAFIIWIFNEIFFIILF